MSEMRRAARRLVEARTETFESRHPREASAQRLQQSLARLPEADRGFSRSWAGDEARPVLTARFEPSPRTRRFLKALSVAMSLLVAVAIASWFGSDRALAWMASITAVLAFLGMPFVILGLASHQDARESRIARAIRVALQDEDEKFPPPQRWADED
jgi:hypothetical protein